MKILCAIDDSQFSNSVIDALIRQAKPNETEVRVLHAIEPMVPFPEGYVWGDMVKITAAQRDEAQKLLVRAEQRLRDAGFRVTTAIAEGNPKVVIIDSAAEWRADVIMIGSHGRKGLDRFLLGSVSEAVARHAQCSVQIVRLKPESAAL